jgi:hypothetical protein
MSDEGRARRASRTARPVELLTFLRERAKFYRDDCFGLANVDDYKLKALAQDAADDLDEAIRALSAARAEGEAAGRAQEREDCAKVADEWRATYHEHAKDAHLRMLLNDASNYQQTAHLCESLAAAIRARAVGGGQ